MTIIVADNTPPAVRGMLKRWFIEPRPNVFVGTINRRVRQKVIQYVRRLAPDLGMLNFSFCLLAGLSLDAERRLWRH